LIFSSFKRAAGALALAFMLAATPSPHDQAFAARKGEPYSCKTGGRTYNPQSSHITVSTRTGAILSGERIDERLPPASMTKMMTAALIFEALREGKITLKDKITVQHSPAVLATRGESNSTWLKEGVEITVEEALIAIVAASSNNVAVLAAEKIAGSEEAFVALMNEKARALGMHNTQFRNPHGLPNADQYSTARDMAKLAQHLIKEYPGYYHYFETSRAEFGPWRGKLARRNHNTLALRNEHIDGIKTGFTCASGYNVTASGLRNGERVITVVFGGRTPHLRDEKARGLIESGLRQARQAEKPGTPHLNDDSPQPAEPTAPKTGPAP